MQRVSELALEYAQKAIRGDYTAIDEGRHRGLHEAAAAYLFAAAREQLLTIRDSKGMAGQPDILHYEQQIRRMDELLFTNWEDSEHATHYSKKFESPNRAREALALLKDIFNVTLKQPGKISQDEIDSIRLASHTYHYIMVVAEGRSRESRVSR